jgi:oligopeptide/dipeptide ABC transporter ATP-binding protein
VSGAAAEAVLEARGLVKHYPVKGLRFGRRPVVHALDGVSFELARGETLGVVGESGCGKTTLAKCLLRLERPTAGRVLLLGRDVTQAGARSLRAMRRHLQIVFQDPYASLNPRRPVGSIVADPLRLHGLAGRRRRRDQVALLLERVGLGRELIDRHPHELSGGQRQRVAIARALAVGPQAIVCDEPVSSLDVSVQAQVINLLMRLKREMGLAYLFISHDLALVQHVSDRVLVMYLGEAVELAPTRELRARPLHPYTQALFSAAPVADPGSAGTGRIILAGDVPSPIEPPAGCRFHTRCPYVQGVCTSQAPELRAVEGRLVRCHFAGEPGFPPAAGHGQPLRRRAPNVRRPGPHARERWPT